MAHSKFFSLVFCVLALSSCTIIAKTDVKQGIGTSCTSNDDCNGSTCNNNICVSSCNTNADCVTGSVCANKLCQLPLNVGLIYTGDKNDEGWTKAHVDGLNNAINSLGYVKPNISYGVLPGSATEQIDNLIAKGSTLILGNSIDYSAEFFSAAKKYPNIRFSWVGDDIQSISTENANTVWVKRIQSWYLAGKLAASFVMSTNPTKDKKRLGVIDAFINSETTRNINAYTLGAQSIDPSFVVEVRYLGFWFDTNSSPTFTFTKDNNSELLFREEYLAAQLMATGCQVISHLSNTQRSVRYIEKKRKTNNTSTYSFANDYIDGCKNSEGAPYSSCLGSIYENWTNIYVAGFDRVHRNIKIDYPVSLNIDESDTSPVNVSINSDVIGEYSPSLRTWIREMVQNNPDTYIFKGNVISTGQRTLSGSVSVEEQKSMCWFVKGVVEKTNLLDYNSEDKDAQVPDGSHKAPSDIVLPEGSSSDCIQNQKLLEGL